MEIFNPRYRYGESWFLEFDGDIFDWFNMRLHGGNYSEIIISPAQFFLVHTISGDNAQGAGIARTINSLYRFRDNLVADKARNLGLIESGWRFDRSHGCFKNPCTTDTIRFIGKPGDVYYTLSNPHIVGLITKERYYEKPSLDDMYTALISLRETWVAMAVNHIDDGIHNKIELIMPHIGCGLDGLDWDDVSELIFETFLDFRDHVRIVAVDYPKK